MVKKKNKKTAEAQDELIKFMLAPMQRKLDRLEAENKRRDIEQAEYQAKYDADLKAGVCVAQYGIGCECLMCERNDRAYDAIENKKPDVTAFDALIQAGFNEAEAKEEVDIFDDLGIFTDEELFPQGLGN